MDAGPEVHAGSPASPSPPVRRQPTRPATSARPRRGRTTLSRRAGGRLPLPAKLAATTLPLASGARGRSLRAPALGAQSDAGARRLHDGAHLPAQPSSGARSHATRSTVPLTVSLRAAASWVAAKDAGVPCAGSHSHHRAQCAALTDRLLDDERRHGAQGFSVGEEVVRDVLRPAQAASTTRCINCHASTPDGHYAAFSASRRARTAPPARSSTWPRRHRRRAAPITAAARSSRAHPSSNRSSRRRSGPASGASLLNMLEVDQRLGRSRGPICREQRERRRGWGIVRQRRRAVGRLRDRAPRQLPSRTRRRRGWLEHQHTRRRTSSPFLWRRQRRAMPLRGASGPRTAVLSFLFARRPLRRVQPRSRRGLVVQQRERRDFPGALEGGVTALRLRANDPPACLERRGQCHQQLAEVVARRRRVGRPLVLLADVLVDARGATASRSTSRPWSSRAASRPTPRGDPLESARRRGEPHPPCGTCFKIR